MANLAGFKGRLSERGLVVLGFDGHTLLLGYDMRADKAIREDRRAVGIDELNRYAVDTMREIEADGSGELFPGIRTVRTAADYFLDP